MLAYEKAEKWKGYVVGGHVRAPVQNRLKSDRPRWGRSPDRLTCLKVDKPMAPMARRICHQVPGIENYGPDGGRLHNRRDYAKVPHSSTVKGISNGPGRQLRQRRRRRCGLVRQLKSDCLFDSLTDGRGRKKADGETSNRPVFLTEHSPRTWVDTTSADS